MKPTSKINRRQMLAAAACTIVPRHVLGGEQTPPSEKLNIAGVGIGGMGSGDIRNCAGENIVALCDVDQRALARNPGSAAYADTLGLVYIKRNLNGNAIKVLRKVVDKNPSRAAFRYHLALALFQNGDREGARRELMIARNSKLSAAEATKIHDLLAKLDG